MVLKRNRIVRAFAEKNGEETKVASLEYSTKAFEVCDNAMK